MKEFSVLMSLMDYIPAILFTAACVILVRDLYNKMSKGAFALICYRETKEGERKNGMRKICAGVYVLIAVIVLSLVLISSFCMGYLSSKDFASVSMAWIAEGVNTIGQSALLVAAIIMHRNNLESSALHGGERIQ